MLDVLDHRTNEDSHPGWTLARVLLSGGVLAFLLWRVDLGRIFSVIGRVRPMEIVAFAGVMGVVSLLHAKKWQILLRAWRIDVPYTATLRWLLSGMFFNNVLPTGIGGDAVRLYESGRASERVADPLAVIVYDRFLSLVALAGLGLVALAIQGDPTGGATFWVFFGAVSAGVAVIWFLGRTSWAHRSIAWLSERIDLVAQLRLSSLFESLHARDHRARGLFPAVLIALPTQIASIGAYFVIAIALDLPLSIWQMFLFIPVLHLAVLVPISINGIGVREGVLVLLLGLAGVSQTEALSFSFTYFVLLLAFSLIGAVTYIWSQSDQGHPAPSES